MLNNLEEYFVDEEVTEEIIEDVQNFQPQEMSEMEKQLFLSDHFESNLLKQENKWIITYIFDLVLQLFIYKLNYDLQDEP